MNVERKLEQFLDEDVGNGDITTDSLVDPTTRSIGSVICKERAIVDGLAESIILLKLVGCEGRPQVRYSQEVPADTVVLEINGGGVDVNNVERTRQHLLSHLAGVASPTYDPGHITDTNGA